MLHNIQKFKKSTAQLKASENSKGFTIIEVMIVLAIAGLILLIVFLAVPALQRSARNTSRKNDTASVAGAVSNYISNNNGSIPDTVTLNGANNLATVKCANGGANGSTCDKTDTNIETAKIAAFTTISTDATAKATDTAANVNTLLYVPGWNCNSSNTGLGAPSLRSAAFLFQLESGGAATNQCQEQ